MLEKKNIKAAILFLRCTHFKINFKLTGRRAIQILEILNIAKNWMTMQSLLAFLSKCLEDISFATAVHSEITIAMTDAKA